MMRLDKFLVSMNLGSRSQVKNFIKKGQITIDGTICKDDVTVEANRPNRAIICRKNKEL